MAKRKRSKGGACNGDIFKMKTKRGNRCACATTNSEGEFFAHFVSGDACPSGGKAITYKQARKKYGQGG